MDFKAYQYTEALLLNLRRKKRVLIGVSKAQHLYQKKKKKI